MFSKLLIANRGEIACRVAVSARRMGLRVAAVYSEADANARHVRLADEAYCIGPPAARDSYLKIDAILDAAKKCGAGAIHPGYGFLSENEDFAAACDKAGIAFIGPPAAAIRAMGSKAAAKALMEKAGVPLVPGYHGEKQDPAFLQREAERIGWPVLIKASAGGGGKGMRIVEKAADFAASLASCQREASSAFGDGRVLLEKYLRRPRHIEIQVFADQHGQCVSLFERDCSVQRRHQKVLEEAPAPGMGEERRRAMGDAAVAAAKAVGYVGAGTVEFIVSAEGTFYFMEMNTRLQVEHPVTEMITGLDLVQWQLRVAMGEPLSALCGSWQALGINGHAIEARIYAENPAKRFLPSTGRLTHLRFPPAAEFEREQDGHRAAVRVDSGVRQGDTISPWYDPMIAKLIAWGETRDIALSRLAAALAGCQVVGVHTNVEFLRRVLATRAFSSGAVHTGLIDDNASELFPAATAPAELTVAAAVLHILTGSALPNRTDDPHSPWGAGDGWQANLATLRVLKLQSTGEDKTEYTLPVRYAASGRWELDIDGWTPLTGERLSESDLRLDWRGESVTATVAPLRTADGEALQVFAAGRQARFERLDSVDHAAAHAAPPGSLAAPMPGRVITVLVQPGAKVQAGAPLMVLEAMKMEHSIVAPADGTVTAIHFKAGDQVPEGALLATVETGA